MSANDLLALPFDLYQRYLAAAQVAEQVRAHLGRSRLQILDVGGFGRTPQGDACLPLARFLAHDSIVAVDLEQESVTGYAVASGLFLPFPDKSFDLVTSCDTLEHIPSAGRPGFINELLRVSTHCVVLIAPFDSELNRQAERALHDYLAKQGLQHPMLQEHLDNGLPSLNQLEAMLAERRLSFVNLADGYLPHWLIMMLITLTSGQSPGFCLGLNRRYNYHLSPGDRREPAYRRVIVVALPGNEELLPDLASSFCSGDSSPVERDTGFAADLATLLIQTRPADTQARTQLDALEAENAHLRQVVTAYEQGRFMRFMRYVHGLRKKVSPQ